MQTMNDKLFVTMLTRVFALFGPGGKHAGVQIDTGSLFSDGGIHFNDPTKISLFLGRAQAEGWLVRVHGQRSQGGFKSSGTRGYQFAEDAHERLAQLNSVDEQEGSDAQIQALKAELSQEKIRVRELEGKLKAERKFASDLQDELKAVEGKLAELEQSKRVLEDEVAAAKKQQPVKKRTNGVSEEDKLMRLLEARILALKQEVQITQAAYRDILSFVSDDYLRQLLVIAECMPEIISALFDAYAKLEKLSAEQMQSHDRPRRSASSRSLGVLQGVELTFDDGDGPSIRMSGAALAIPSLREALGVLLSGGS